MDSRLKRSDDVPTLKSMLEQSNQGNPLHVVRSHAAWLEMSEDARFQMIRNNRQLVQYVIEKTIFGGGKEGRVGRISASGLGGCQRRSLFGYADAPRLPDDPDSSDLMSMGTHDHLWWQIEGMVCGWLDDVEPFVYDGRLVGGSLDGTGNPAEVPMFELKTVRDNKFNRIVLVDKEPEHAHLIQVDFYMEELELEACSLIYQERGGGSYFEFWIQADDKVRKERHRITERLGNHIASNTLPPMLEDCESRQGFIYRTCPHRKYCPTASTVTVSK